jgi:formylglycine-generating enzyme required for sulfatase activity
LHERRSDLRATGNPTRLEGHVVVTEKDNVEQPEEGVRKLRLFLASPGDVTYERQLAREVIDQVAGERAFRERVSIQTIAWDKPGVRVAMEAGLTPQEAIAQGMPKPADCEMVLVILWSRIGTPLPADYKKDNGSRYRSGTEWEYENALGAYRVHGKPVLWVYRRTEVPLVELNDPELEEKLAQWKSVDAFFDSLINSDGSIAGGVNAYKRPEEFRRLFEQHLRDWLTQRMAAAKAQPMPKKATSATEPPRWVGSPYLGLKAFTETEAPIFFGRGPEVDDLLARFADRNLRFVTVVGASGTGKSSLVMAGLFPRLRQGAIPGSRDWTILPRFTPVSEGSPLCGLGSALATGCKGIDESRWALADLLATAPKTFEQLVTKALTGRPDWAELLIFVDQFEELVTLVPEGEREPFVRVLDVMAHTPRVRVVLTLRADFAHRIDIWPAIVDLRNDNGIYLLKQPDLHALRQMIEGPAQRGGIVLEDGLADRIVEDTGAGPGSFALMAFTLERLYAMCEPDRRLTLAAYANLDGVRGSIAHQADRAFSMVTKAAREALPQIFRELVSVGPEGTATRRRAARETVTVTPPAGELVGALIKARLLVAGEDDRVEVAHEKLFDAWGRLKQWIDEATDDLRLLEKVRQEAADWDGDERARKHLWTHEKLLDVDAALARLGVGVAELDEACREFIRPEAERLLAELEDPCTPHNRRAWIGDRLAEIGDPRPGVGVKEDGTPDIDWVALPEGEVEFEENAGQVRVGRFRMSRYPVTNAQFETFTNAPDGYRNDAWWRGMPVDANNGPEKPRWPEPNRPRETVSWYEAVAFCRWLSHRLGSEVRLATEFEWQQAANSGEPDNGYPWGRGWDPQRCNTTESGLNRTTAVGLYPDGASCAGVFDLAGSVWEWGLSKYWNPGGKEVDDSDRERVMRGGSWYDEGALARCASNFWYYPSLRDDYIGFRVLCSSPIR